MTPTTLILGNGPCAQAALTELLGRDTPVILATREEKLNFVLSDPEDCVGKLEWLAGARLVSCRRNSADGLTLEFDQTGQRVIRQVQEIIIAEESPLVAMFDAHQLAPGEPVWALSTVMEQLGNSEPGDLPWAAGDSVILLNGLYHESHPVMTRRIFSTALRLQLDHGIQSYVITRNLKVAGAGVERLVHQARQAGVVVAKVTGETPTLDLLSGGTPMVTLFDEITGETYGVAAKGVVVDEMIVPDDYVAELGAILELERDADGFLQADNVYRLSNKTNRHAIRVAGPARGVMSMAAQIADGRIAAWAGREPVDFDRHGDLALAEIVQGQCVRCLTCYRLCPYKAIALDDRERVFVREGECRQCGICAAECPRGAITLDGLRPSEMASTLDAEREDGNHDTPAPLIYVFGCSRSAQPANDLARCLDQPLPGEVKLVSVPCAGALSQEHLWAAFAKGAQGVLVLTCHLGNCHSEQGNQLAHQRVDHLKVVLAELGIEPHRLAVRTLAANMGAEFAEWVSQFVEDVKSERSLKETA